MSTISILFLIVTAAVLFVGAPAIMRFLDDSMLIRLSKETYIRSVILFLSVMVLIILYFGRSPNPETEEKHNSDYYIVMIAFDDAKEGVKKMLKAPSTAKFAGYEDTKYRINSDGSVVIESYVDSQNGFGAMLRTYYRCTVRNGEISDIYTW